MKYLSKSIKIYNNSIENIDKNNIKKNSSMCFENTINNVLLFRESIIKLDDYLLFLFNINNQLEDLEKLIRKILNEKLNINSENNIFDTMFNYIIPDRINVPKFKNNYKKNIDLFLRKAFREDIIQDYNQYYNNMKTILFRYNFDKNNSNKLIMFYYKYTNLLDFNNDEYDNKLSFILYWLNIDNDNFVKHYYMQYYLII